MVHADEAAASQCVHHSIPGLAAAVAANPAAAADYAVAALLTPSASASSYVPALMRALTPALALASGATGASFAARVCAEVLHMITPAAGAPAGPLSSHIPSQQTLEAALQVRQLAVAAALTRDVKLAAALERAYQTCEHAKQQQQQLPSMAGALGALESPLSLEEQAGLVQHLLLCPTPAGEAIGELWRALQPLCSQYCRESAHPAAGLHALLLPQWLPAQVLQCGLKGIVRACTCILAQLGEALSALWHCHARCQRHARGAAWQSFQTRWQVSAATSGAASPKHLFWRRCLTCAAASARRLLRSCSRSWRPAC